jgi:transcriptional regulator with XRE-family HTH domain
VGHARRRPKRLAEKLLQIRKALGVSQREMAKRLQNNVDDSHVSKYERNRSEPTLRVLLAYARLAGVELAQIVDDDVDLMLDL